MLSANNVGIVSVKDMNNQHNKGLVIIYTGNGKGKTSAAVGLAVRAVGYKKKVLFLQFIKEWPTGEKESLKLLAPYVTFLQMGEGFIGIWGDKKDKSTHNNAARLAFEFAKEKVKSGEFDIIILDEINIALGEGLLEIDEVLEMVTNKPQELDIVLTGRDASQKLIDIADLVTEMIEIKHPFQNGILAKRGIDF